MKSLFGTILAFAIFAGLAFSTPLPAQTAGKSGGRVYSGLEVFLGHYTDLVAGKRVGLATNQTAVDFGGRHIVDILKADRRIRLACLFAPEHGIRGDIPAGKNFGDMRDPKSGLTVYSLHGGKTHRPSKAQLDQLDVMIFDIQDVGSRAYTFVWHMAEIMAACGEYGKPLIVLDRPNPLGGLVVDGPVREERYKSFIGLYPVPRVYGMTMGEMALYINKEFKLGCDLKVVPMANYKRGMSFKETGLPWVAPSPNIPTPDSACLFAATGTIGVLQTADILCGTPLAFQAISASWLNPEYDAASLNALKLPGVSFVPLTGPVPKLKGGTLQTNGFRIQINSVRTFMPATTELAIMCYLRDRYPGKFQCKAGQDDDFDKAMGNSYVLDSVMKGRPYKSIAARWGKEVEKFEAIRSKYLLKEYN